MKNLINSFNRTAFLMVFVMFLLCGAVMAQEHPMKPSTKSIAAHTMLAPDDLKWMDGPPSVPPGAQFVVIDGDPKNAALFTMRLKLPDNYKIQAHWHPAEEHITVLSGTFMMGLGDKFDDKKLTPLTAGSFAVMPLRITHFAKTKGETIIQLHGMGPWGINYVNPADDPRKKE